MAIVYQVTNTITGHRYIGATSKSLHERRLSHLSKSRQPSAAAHHRFQNALASFGESEFEWAVISTHETHREALDEEERLVAESKPEYNMIPGGGGGHIGKKVISLDTGIIYPTLTAAAKALETTPSEVYAVCRRKTNSGRRTIKGQRLRYDRGEIDESMRSVVLSKLPRHEALQRRRVPVGERKELYRGVEEGCDKKGRSAAGPMKLSRKVVCITDGKVYDSASAAARVYDINKSALIELCLGKRGRRTVGGFVFRYLEVEI